MISHPSPVVKARPAEAGETPRTAASLIKNATELGWWVGASYARGTTIDRFGRPGKVVDSLVVRLELRKVAARAAVIWIDRKFDTAFCWAAWYPLEHIGARAVTGWVTSVATLAEAVGR